METFNYTYDLFKNDTQELVNQCRQFEPDAILAIVRGGLSLSHHMAQALNIRNLYTLNSIYYEDDIKQNKITIFNVPDIKNAKKLLIVDDIVDSGKTLKTVTKLISDKFPYTACKTATLFYKKTAIFQPDFTINEAKHWIGFFWESDIT